MHHLRLYSVFGAAVGFASMLTLSGRNASAAEALTLEEVTVTAQKRTENLQDVPATVSVIGADAIGSLHATQLADIGAYVPGLQVDSNGTPGQTILSIRGISPISANATVGSYIDDTPIGSTGFHDRGGSYALDLLPYDVRQIEVLSGPQGTLYGANALGGLIKYDLTTPSLNSSEFRVGGTLFGIDHSSGVGSGFRGYANTMLIPDELGMIASVGQERTPGYIDNTATHRSDQNTDLQRSARLGLLWQITDAAALKINGLYANTESDGSATVALDPTTMKPLGGDLTDNNLRPNVYDNTLWYFAATLNWKLPFADFVSATSWSKKSDRFIQDATYTYQPLLPLLGAPADGIVDFPLFISAKRFSQELRLSSNSHAALEWLVGLYYDYEKGTNTQFLRTFDANGSSLASLGIDPLFAAALPTIYREYSGFANATWHTTSRWDFGGGVRYARNVQGFSQIIEPGSAILPPSNVPGKSAEGVTTWLGRTNFKFTEPRRTDRIHHQADARSRAARQRFLHRCGPDGRCADRFRSQRRPAATRAAGIRFRATGLRPPRIRGLEFPCGNRGPLHGQALQCWVVCAGRHSNGRLYRAGCQYGPQQQPLDVPGIREEPHRQAGIPDRIQLPRHYRR